MKYMIVDMCDRDGIEGYSIFDSEEEVEAYSCYWDRANVIADNSNYALLEVGAYYIKYYNKDSKTIDFMQLIKIDNF